MWHVKLGNKLKKFGNHWLKGFYYIYKTENKDRIGPLKDDPDLTFPR